MTAEEYFGLIIYVLMGLTFIALVLIFLYMIYGGKEEATSSPKVTFIRNVLNTLLFRLCSLAVLI